MSKFKVGQVWVTRDGRKARIVATDRKGSSYPIIALVKDDNCECEYTDSFTASGSRLDSGQCKGDLIREHREPREVWVLYGGASLSPIDATDEDCRHDARYIRFREVIE